MSSSSSSPIVNEKVKSISRSFVFEQYQHSLLCILLVTYFHGTGLSLFEWFSLWKKHRSVSYHPLTTTLRRQLLVLCSFFLIGQYVYGLYTLFHNPPSWFPFSVQEGWTVSSFGTYLVLYLVSLVFAWFPSRSSFFSFLVGLLFFLHLWGEPSSSRRILRPVPLTLRNILLFFGGIVWLQIADIGFQMMYYTTQLPFISFVVGTSIRWFIDMIVQILRTIVLLGLCLGLLYEVSLRWWSQTRRRYSSLVP